MDRLKYVDMIRGSAVLWMISIQLLDMFTNEFNMYVEHYDFALKYVNWLPIFFIVSGFSLRLMVSKYDRKTFLKRNIIRGLKFVVIGVLLTLWCGWNLPTPFDEVVSSIGMNVLIFSILLYCIAFSAKGYCLASLFVLMSCLVAFNAVFYVEGAFNPFWSLSFMIFGFILASSKDVKFPTGRTFPLNLGLVFLYGIDYFGRTFGFWVLNVVFVSLFFILMMFLERFKTIAGLLGYFGRHSLFLYVLHFAIFQKLLLVANSYDIFPLEISILFVALSILTLVFIERVFVRLRFPKSLLSRMHA